MTKDTSKGGYGKGDVVTASGFPAIVISPTKGIRTMCAVFGWGLDIGDVYTVDVYPADEAAARAGATENGYGAQFDTYLKKYRAEKAKDDARKAAKAAKAGK